MGIFRATTWLPGLFVFLLLCSCDQAQPEKTAKKTAAAHPDSLVLAIGGEEEQGYDPTMGWGRYGSPLFHSTLLRYNDALEIEYDLATAYECQDPDDCIPVRIQVPSATFWQAPKNSFFGVLKLRDFLGLLLRLSMIKLMSCWLNISKSVPFGRYWRISPFVFSLSPRS